MVTTHPVAGNAHIWAKNGENLLSKCSFITYKLRFLKNIFTVFIAKSERSDQYKVKGGEQILFMLTNSRILQPCHISLSFQRYSGRDFWYNSN